MGETQMLDFRMTRLRLSFPINKIFQIRLRPCHMTYATIRMSSLEGKDIFKSFISLLR